MQNQETNSYNSIFDQDFVFFNKEKQNTPYFKSAEKPTYILDFGQKCQISP